MDKCLKCGDFIWANEKIVFGKDKHYYCGSCLRKSMFNTPSTKITKDTIAVNLKVGSTIIFANADDYTIDNENGWLHICKDNKKKATLSLSEVKSVFVE